MKNFLIVPTLILCGVYSTPETYAGDNQTLYLDVRYGFSTIKSEILQANDTTTSMGYGLGVNAGAEKNFGVELWRETVTASFLLNETSFTATWQDLAFTYRWNWIAVGAIVAGVDASAKDASGDSVFSAVASGYGGIISLDVPVQKSFFFTEIRYASYGTIAEKDEKDLTIGPRMDISLGGKVPLTKRNLDLIFGYRQRTYPIILDGASSNEWTSDTFLGLQWGLNF